MPGSDYEVERARIARELHDDTIQSLVAIAQSIDMGRSWFEVDPSRALTMLQSAHRQAVETGGLSGGGSVHH